jgi:hypothetical protein
MQTSKYTIYFYNEQCDSLSRTDTDHPRRKLAIVRKEGRRMWRLVRNSDGRELTGWRE